jgi:hypothetical protein
MLAKKELNINIGVGVGILLQVAGVVLLGQSDSFAAGLLIAAGFLAFVWGCANYCTRQAVLVGLGRVRTAGPPRAACPRPAR